MARRQQGRKQINLATLPPENHRNRQQVKFHKWVTKLAFTCQSCLLLTLHLPQTYYRMVSVYTHIIVPTRQFIGRRVGGSKIHVLSKSELITCCVWGDDIEESRQETYVST